MGFLPVPLRTLIAFVWTRVVLPAVRRLARETLSEARARYQQGRSGRELSPTVSRLDPSVLARLVPFVATGRLLRRLVVARPMGP